jgi:hypothetical protein
MLAAREERRLRRPHDVPAFGPPDLMVCGAAPKGSSIRGTSGRTGGSNGALSKLLGLLLTVGGDLKSAEELDGKRCEIAHEPT